MFDIIRERPKTSGVATESYVPKQKNIWAKGSEKARVPPPKPGREKNKG